MNKVYLETILTRHSCRNSAFDSSNTCENCDKSHCDLCKAKYEVVIRDEDYHVVKKEYVGYDKATAIKYYYNAFIRTCMQYPINLSNVKVEKKDEKCYITATTQDATEKILIVPTEPLLDLRGVNFSIQVDPIKLSPTVIMIFKDDDIYLNNFRIPEEQKNIFIRDLMR